MFMSLMITVEKEVRARGLTLADFAAQIGVTPPNITNWKKRDIPGNKYQLVAEGLGWTVDELLAGGPGRAVKPVHRPPSLANVGPANLGAHRIPLISYVKAGRWQAVSDPYPPGAADDWLLTSRHCSGSAFALRIKGKSMLPRFEEGDDVIIDPSLSPRPGDFVVAKNHQEEATFKKYRPRGYTDQGAPVFELVPLNEDYATLRSDQEPIVIIGVMVEHRHYRQ